MDEESCTSPKATHLADRQPQIEQPLRIEAPADLKAPQRLSGQTRDSLLRRLRYSPEAHSLTRRVLAEKGPEASDETIAAAWRRQTMEREHALAAFEATTSSLQSQILKYSTIAASSHRAGKHMAEAQAYFAMGVVYDNARLYKEAAGSYKKLLRVAETVDDPTLRGLAFNALGVDCMLIASPPGMGAPDKPSTIVERAAWYHDKHRRCADDGGQFAAFTNLGLCATWLGDVLAAARHHQDALRLAIQLQSRSGQCVAVGNLGALALSTRDVAAARPCLEQHLQLVDGEAEAQSHALLLLGQLAMEEADFHRALECFERAADVAADQNHFATRNHVACLVGRAKAQIRRGAHFGAFLENAAKTDPELFN